MSQSGESRRATPDEIRDWNRDDWARLYCEHAKRRDAGSAEASTRVPGSVGADPEHTPVAPSRGQK